MIIGRGMLSDGGNSTTRCTSTVCMTRFVLWLQRPHGTYCNTTFFLCHHRTSRGKQSLMCAMMRVVFPTPPATNQRANTHLWSPQSHEAPTTKQNMHNVLPPTTST